MCLQRYDGMHDIYIWCIRYYSYTVFFGWKITKNTVIYGVYIRVWPTLRVCLLLCAVSYTTTNLAQAHCFPLPTDFDDSQEVSTDEWMRSMSLEAPVDAQWMSVVDEVSVCVCVCVPSLDLDLGGVTVSQTARQIGCMCCA
jgi:hypothetical protein